MVLDVDANARGCVRARACACARAPRAVTLSGNAVKFRARPTASAAPRRAARVRRYLSLALARPTVDTLALLESCGAVFNEGARSDSFA